MDYHLLLSNVNSLLFNHCLIRIFPDTLRKRLQPLTTKVEHLHKSHNRRYYKLKKVENRLKIRQ